MAGVYNEHVAGATSGYAEDAVQGVWSCNCSIEEGINLNHATSGHTRMKGSQAVSSFGFHLALQ